MAKRKRLTPARPDFLDAELSGTEFDPVPAETVSAPEAKAMFPLGVARMAPSRPPIAQVAGEASVRAALDELTQTMTRVRAEGRLLEALPLDQIDADHLVRDRMVQHDDEMQALLASLRARGQQVPVEVIDRGEGTLPRYGLISGWRRLMGLRMIASEPEQSLSEVKILAIVRQPKSSAEAYVAMVEENEIRADISFYERARIVLKALEGGVFSESKQALQSLFGNVSRAKRSKIKSFMTIVAALDGALRFPAAISERAGLDLVKRLEADPGLAGRLQARLDAVRPQTAEAELAILMTPERPAPQPAAEDAAPEPAQSGFVVELDAEAQVITISGEGVDARLLRDLERWLSRR